MKEPVWATIGLVTFVIMITTGIFSVIHNSLPFLIVSIALSPFLIAFGLWRIRIITDNEREK